MLELTAATPAEVRAWRLYMMRTATDHRPVGSNAVPRQPAGNIKRAAIGAVGDAIALRAQMVDGERFVQRPSSNCMTMDAVRPTWPGATGVLDASIAIADWRSIGIGGAAAAPSLIAVRRMTLSPAARA